MRKEVQQQKWSTIQTAMGDWGTTLRLAFLLVIVAVTGAVPVVLGALLFTR